MEPHEIDYTRILSMDEIKTVVKDLRRKSRRSPNGGMNLAIFRLSCCAGLRRCEISGLDVQDVVVNTGKPYVMVKSTATKKNRFGVGHARKVPLWWDSGTLDDVSRWLEIRNQDGAARLDPFVCVRRQGASQGQQMSPVMISARWKTAVASLSSDRRARSTVHDGRHSFCSHSLAAGRSLIEVKKAAGHRSVIVTEIYLHNVDREGVVDVFATAR